MFTVTDIKQYEYCARVLYYQGCLPRVRPTTDKMEAGREAHDNEETREHRRSLQPYGVREAERQFNLRLFSEQLGLSGMIDLLLLMPDGQENVAWPVDYKLTMETGPNIRLQLAAYAVLIEECLHKQVDRGYIYEIPMRRVEQINIGAAQKQRVREALAQMHRIVAEERMPPPVKERGKCVDCEFRRFCNDI